MDSASLAQAAVLSGVSVTLVTEILKSQYIPVPAQKYKRTTALILSIAVSAYAVYQYDVANIVVVSWQDWLALILLTMLVSSITYNQIVKTLNV